MRIAGGKTFIINPVFYKSATHIADKTKDFICTFPVSSQNIKSQIFGGISYSFLRLDLN